MQYRRAKLAGATYFFTLTLADRREHLLTENIQQLRHAIKHVQDKHPFVIDAMVVLPEHLHALWTLPVGDAEYSTRWALIKAGFSRSIAKEEKISLSRQRKGERGIWQRRFWEHLIRDENDFTRHVDYIHYNPVKHGHVMQCCDWPYSSFHRYVREGFIAQDWGGHFTQTIDCNFGE